VLQMFFVSFCWCIFICLTYSSVTSFRANRLVSIHSPYISRKSTSTLALAVENSLVSTLAGSAAGAVGLFAAYPFDSLKTKAQTFKGGNSVGILGMIKIVMKEEGLRGFYSGVFGMMVGQALIKAVAFGSNNWALNIQSPGQHSIIQLVLAASFSGFTASFLVNPVERVKILMQADNTGQYTSEWECITKIVSQDGLFGLLFRGVDATIVREIPGYALYFVIYHLLIESTGQWLGSGVAPLLCGAAAGCLSWLPVYPIDVIKTNMQNTRGNSVGSIESTSSPTVTASLSSEKPSISSSSSSSSDTNSDNLGMLDMAIQLFKSGGLAVFYEGITPKLIRAAVNHSVTFYVYDLITTKLLT